MKRSASVVVMATLATLVASPSPAQAADRVFHVLGSGWGHGVGLSQYGAYAQALDGRDARTIIRSYYDGVSFDTRSAESIRVLLESGGDGVVTSASSFTAWQNGTKIATSSSSYPYLRSVPTADGFKVMRAASASGSWTTIKTTTSTSPIWFKPGSAMLRFVYDGGASRRYRGEIYTRRVSASKVYSINLLDVDQYLYGVVTWEMPASWHAEALKAQAMVARSYAINKKIRSRQAGIVYDICTSTACQVYGGYDAETSSGVSAVKATARVVVTHADSSTTASGVILAVFSSSSGGRTENNTDGFGSSTLYPYLSSVPDGWSRDPAVKNPYAAWERTFSASTLASKVGLNDVWMVRVKSRNQSGSAETVEFVGVKDGSPATVSKTGLWLRSALSLPSIFVTKILVPPFVDDDGTSYEPYTTALANAGIVSGCRPDRFCLWDIPRREHLAALLARSLDLPPASQDYFTDDDGHRYEDLFNRVAEAGIMTGHAGKLYPTRESDREQVAALMVRAFGLPPTDTDYFDDDEGHRFEAEINAFRAAGITFGCGRRRYCPDDMLTRASLAVFLANALDLV